MTTRAGEPNGSREVPRFSPAVRRWAADGHSGLSETFIIRRDLSVASPDSKDLLARLKGIRAQVDAL